MRKTAAVKRATLLAGGPAFEDVEAERANPALELVSNA